MKWEYLLTQPIDMERYNLILFTADWHIKLGQKRVPVEWAINRYREFFAQVHKIDCTLHIIGGDLFDKLPSLQELELYFEFIKDIKVRTIILDGNHEATKKNKTFFEQLKRVTEALNPLVTVIVTTTEYTDFTILPYADLHKPSSIEKCNTDKALFTHVRGEIPPHVKPEVDLDRFKDFPIVYAGDLHSHSNCQRNIVYPGSPMTTSFHRNRVKTGYILIDEEDLTKWSWHEFELPQLIRKTVSDPAEMIPTDYDHTIYEVEGDMQHLKTVDNSELLDKKIVRRNTEVAVDMKDKTVVEELAAYLDEVMLLDSDAKDAALEVFNANASKS